MASKLLNVLPICLLIDMVLDGRTENFYIVYALRILLPKMKLYTRRVYN